MYQVYPVTLPTAFLRAHNVLAFEIPDAASPQELGVGADDRLLGIRVQWIQTGPPIPEVDPK